MVHTQWEKQTGLCLRKQMQQASAKSYAACFKDKKRKTIFLTERKRDRSLQKFSANFYFFEIPSAFPPSSSHTHWINKPRCSQEYVPRYPPRPMPCKCKGRCLTADAQEFLCANCWLQSDVQTVCIHFCKGKASWTEHTSEALKIQKFSVYKKMHLLIVSFGCAHPESLSF